MTTPVSFELAKLLKEKAFDDICYSYYVDQVLRKGPFASTTIHSEYSASPSVKEIRNSDFSLKCYKLHKKEFVSAPTIAEVVMWLYEKYGIWIECLHRGDMGDFTFKVSKLKKGWRTEPHYIHRNGINSPTEAYEAAIEYTLKHLI